MSDHDDDDDSGLLVSGLVADTHDTSHAAAVSNKSTAATQRAEVLAHIEASGNGGCTDDEIQEALGLDGSSERPRRWELWKRGDIQIKRDATGEAVKRKTRTGRDAVVWIMWVAPF